ncbi:hypothetical protein ACKKBG_A33100 [Auxenochlorella protothecoides x Auxenochlorella symbiontica]
MSGALAARGASEEGNRGRVEATKVRRYWPGKRPDWVGNEEEEDLAVPSTAPAAEDEPTSVQRTDIAAPVVVLKEDPRLRRLQQQQAELAVSEPGRHRDITEPQVVRRRREAETSGRDEDGEAPSSEDEDALERRRAAVRERLKQEEAAAVAQEVEQESEESEEESSEYETESSEEESLAPRLLLKPVFVPKADRETIMERELLARQEEARLAAEQARAEIRKVETKEILAHRLEVEAAEEASAKEGPRGMDDVVTDDDADDDEEAYEAWRLRELRRIGMAREAREREEREAAEKERWRNMSEEERRRHLALNPREVAPKPKKKWGFLQKYWHKGAFFQEEGDAQVEDGPVLGALASRDFSAPTGQDKFDRSTLPKVMQVKNFGRRGQTKWTHLADQDTTDWGTPWVQNDSLRNKYNQKMAASEQVFTKPKSTRT